MEVEYRLLPEDVIAFQESHRGKRKPMPSPWVALVILATVVVGIVVSPSRQPSGLPTQTKTSWSSYLSVAAALGMLAVGFGIPIFAPLINRRGIRKALDGKDFQDAQYLRICAEGVATRSPTGSGLRYWDALEKIVATETHLFFYIAPTHAYIVPRRAFPDDAAFQEFASAAKSFHASVALDAFRSTRTEYRLGKT